MARFSGALTQGLMNPTYAGTLSQAAGMLGGLGGDLRQQRLTEERTSALRAEADPRKRLELMLQQAKTPQEIMQVQKAIQEFDQQAAQEGRAQAAEGRAQAAEGRAQGTYDSTKAREQAVARISMLEGERDRFKDNPKALDNINMVINRLAAEHGIDLAEREKDVDMPWSSVGKHLYNKETGQTRLLPSETDPSGEPWDPNDFAQRIQKLIDEGTYTEASVSAYGKAFKDGDVFAAAELLEPVDVASQEASRNKDTSQDARAKRDTITSIKQKAAQYSEGDQAGNIAKGVTQSFMSTLSGSDARAVYDNVDTLKADLSFKELTAMREASKTGGALGSITERELDQLARRVKDLNPRNPDFLTNLEYIDSYYEQILDEAEGPEGGSPNFVGGTPLYESPVDGLVYDFDGSITGTKGARVSDKVAFAYLESKGIQ